MSKMELKKTPKTVHIFVTTYHKKRRVVTIEEKDHFDVDDDFIPPTSQQLVELLVLEGIVVVCPGGYRNHRGYGDRGGNGQGDRY